MKDAVIVSAVRTPVGRGIKGTLANTRPGLVEYHHVEGAKHIRCWNIDPKRYEGELESFVGRVLGKV